MIRLYMTVSNHWDTCQTQLGSGCHVPSSYACSADRLGRRRGSNAIDEHAFELATRLHAHLGRLVLRWFFPLAALVGAVGRG